MVFGMIDEGFAIDGEGSEYWRCVVPSQVPSSVFHDEIWVLGQFTLFHELVEGDLLIEESSIGRDL